MTTHSLGSAKQNVLLHLTNTMQEMLSDFTAKITKTVDTMIHEMQSQLTALRLLYENKLKLLEQSLNTLKATCDSNVKKYNRISTQKKLVVEGVPIKAGENLSKYFSSMCISLGYTNKQLPIADLYRTKSSSIGIKTPIVIEFALCSQRDAFFRRYLHTRALSLIHLGFDVDTRIYINESLTPLTRRLLSDALSMKRNGKLKAVYTRSGIINVQSTNGKFVINNYDDLHRAAKSTI